MTDGRRENHHGEERRQVLRSGARYLCATAIGALALTLGLRRRDRSARYCDRAGRCGGCRVTADCDAYQAMNGRGGR